MNYIDEKSLILIIYKDRKYLKEAISGKSFHGKGGTLEYADLLGKPYGRQYGGYEVFEPTFEDIIMYGLRRETQIIFPKDSAYILFKMNIRPGMRILEFGTGSAAMTLVFSRYLGPEGSVVSFEIEERHHRNAKKNIDRFASWKNVELHLGDISEYDGAGFDAVFIDVREPWLFLEKARNIVRDSGMIGTIIPTANQVSAILKGMENGFGDVEVLELMLRKYKTISERVRPEDRMIAHTGYLAFARKLEYKENCIQAEQERLQTGTEQ